MNPRNVFTIFMFSQGLQAAEIPTYFDKTLNTQVLEASFEKQGLELIQFIKSHGVEFISTTPGESSSVSDEDRRYWQIHLIKHSALGRYYSPFSVSSEVNSPTIIVHAMKDKWTTLHEFMHFLYEKHRMEAGLMRESELFEAQQNARADYLESIGIMHSLIGIDFNAFNRAAKAFADFIKFELSLSRQALLEEITIEQTLSKLYLQNRIPGLYPAQQRTAHEYVKDAAGKFSKQLETYFDIQSDLEKSNIGRENTDLQTSRESLQSIKTQLVQVLTTD